MPKLKFHDALSSHIIVRPTARSIALWALGVRVPTRGSSSNGTENAVKETIPKL